MDRELVLLMKCYLSSQPRQIVDAILIFAPTIHVSTKGTFCWKNKDTFYFSKFKSGKGKIFCFVFDFAFCARTHNMYVSRYRFCFPRKDPSFHSKHTMQLVDN